MTNMSNQHRDIGCLFVLVETIHVRPGLTYNANTVIIVIGYNLQVTYPYIVMFPDGHISNVSCCEITPMDIL